MSTQWIKHKDKEILLVKYAQLSEEEIIATIQKTNKEIENYQGKCLALVNWENAYVTKKIEQVISKSQKIYKTRVEKLGLVGITGVKKIINSFFAAILGMPMKTFNTEEDAKKWLAADN
jgi:hypothetical protein